MTLCAFFAALCAVCSWLSIPFLHTSFTMQTFALFLTLGLLGGKWGCAAIGLYLMVGIVGMPVFSGFRGGPGMLLGAAGGFLWGFALAGLVYWGLERFGRLPAMIAGQIVCYLCGSFWFLVYSGGGIGAVLLQCVVPFLIPDALKLSLAYTLSKRLERHLP